MRYDRTHGCEPKCTLCVQVGLWLVVARTGLKATVWYLLQIYKLRSYNNIYQYCGVTHYQLLIWWLQYYSSTQNQWPNPQKWQPQWIKTELPPTLSSSRNSSKLECTLQSKIFSICCEALYNICLNKCYKNNYYYYCCCYYHYYHKKWTKSPSC